MKKCKDCTYYEKPLITEWCMHPKAAYVYTDYVNGGVNEVRHYTCSAMRGNSIIGFCGCDAKLFENKDKDIK